MQSSLLRELTKKYKTRNKILASKSDKIFNGILLAWFISGYFLGNILISQNISYSDCTLCEFISLYLPSIHKASIGSYYQDATQYAWLYFLLTSPIVLIALFIFVQEFNRRVMQTWVVTFFIVVGLVGVYICFVGMSFGGEDASGRFSQLYYKYYFYSTLVAFSFSAMIVASIFLLANHFKGIINKD